MRLLAARLLVPCAAALCLVTAATPDPDPSARRGGRQGETRVEQSPGQAAGQAAGQTVEQAVERLAVGLGAPTARARQDAEDALAAIGPAAVPALERIAAATDDAEVRERARRLVGLARTAAGTGATADADARRAEARLILRRLPSASRDFAAGSVLDRALAALAPESSEALAAAVIADGGRALLDEHVALALVRRPVPASFDALAQAWLADGIAPSAAHAAASAIEASDASPALREAARRAADLLVSHSGRVDAPRRRARVALVAAFLGAGAEEFLTTATADPDPGVRTEAVRALGRHVPGRAAETLRRAAGDADAGVRIAALEALARVPGSPRPEPAVAAASDEDARVRRAAAELLARDATPDELPVLAALAADASAPVRYAARAALRGFGL